jgi:hypothetical protein
VQIFVKLLSKVKQEILMTNFSRFPKCLSLFAIILFFSINITAQEVNKESEGNDAPETTAEAVSLPTNESAVGENGSVKPEAEKTADSAPQERRRDYKLRRGAREFLLEPNFAPFNPTKFAGPDEYDRTGRSLAMLSFKLGRVIGTAKGITTTYLFGFTPLAVAYGNEVKNSDYVSAEQTPNVPRTKRETSYGVGSFRPNSRIKPFAQAGAGLMVFNKSMPIPEARKLQFSGDFGGGLQIHTSPNRVVTIGYRYFHLSNGNLTPKVYNVGYNAQTFYIGYSFFH